MTRIFRDGVSWAGIAAGGIAWFISTSAGYAVAPIDCGRPLGPALLVALGCIVLACAGGVLSWPAWHGRQTSDADDALAATPRLTVAAVSVLIAALFASVILLQLLAALLLSGCER